MNLNYRHTYCKLKLKITSGHSNVVMAALWSHLANTRQTVLTGARNNDRNDPHLVHSMRPKTISYRPKRSNRTSENESASITPVWPCPHFITVPYLSCQFCNNASAHITVCADICGSKACMMMEWIALEK